MKSNNSFNKYNQFRNNSNKSKKHTSSADLKQIDHLSKKLNTISFTRKRSSKKHLKTEVIGECQIIQEQEEEYYQNTSDLFREKKQVGNRKIRGNQIATEKLKIPLRNTQRKNANSNKKEERNFKKYNGIKTERLSYRSKSKKEE